MKDHLKEIARVFKKARKECGLTIAEIEKRSKVRRELIDKIERGQGYNIYTLIRLMQFYEIKIELIQKAINK